MAEIVKTEQPKVVKKPIDSLKSILSAPSVQEQFSNVLKENKDIFVASLIELFSSESDLQKCDPKLIVTEALKAASMKLPLNKSLGFSYLVPFNLSVKTSEGFKKVMTPTFIVGYKGYIQMAMRTGYYKNLNVDIVYEGELKLRDKLTGSIDFTGEKKSDNIIGYFAYFELINGFSKTLYMTVEEMAKYAKKYSPSIKKETKVTDLIKLANTDVVSSKKGWEGNFTDMALKTVVRRLLSKYGYLSVEMQTALQNDVDDAVASDRDQLVADNANKTIINIEETEFETVSEQPAYANHDNNVGKPEEKEKTNESDTESNSKNQQQSSLFEEEMPGYIKE